MGSVELAELIVFLIFVGIMIIIQSGKSYARHYDSLSDEEKYQEWIESQW